MTTTQFVQTEAGTFRVVVNDDIQYDIITRDAKIIGKLISVGGKNTCVFINAPNSIPTAKFANVKTKEGKCESLGKYIHGKDTITMVLLAFTIVKKVAPNIKILELDDMSDILCTIDDTTSVSIPLSVYELAFYNKTWYERHFGAYLQNPIFRNEYMKAKEGFTKPHTKPEYFSFNNKDLNITLSSIYSKTKTWNEFFSEIYKFDNKCKLMFPWYRDAIKLAMGGDTYERLTWEINLANCKSIKYTETKLGGSRKRKNISLNNLLVHDGNNNYPVSNHILYNDIYDIKYIK